jgi:hypothetical protein
MDSPAFEGTAVPALQTHPDLPSIAVSVPAATSQFKLRFLTATGGRTFVIPPRRRRAFPLLELA